MLYEVVVIERFDELEELEIGCFDLPCPHEGFIIEGSEWGDGFRIIEVAQVDPDSKTAEIIGEWI